MARIITFLLFLLLRNNAYAACYASSWTSYGPVFDSLYVNQGTTLAACQQVACQYYPNIPECGYYLQPTCSNQTEYQSLSCQPHHSGAVNQSRTYTCSSQSWGPWTTTSDNCTPDPATCIQSTETRTLTCSAGFEGSLQEQRNSICSDPYGSPTWTTWLEIYNTCKMTATNLNNPTSPISPISPTNPNSVISQQMNSITTAPMTSVESVTVQDLTAIATTPSTPETPATSVATVKSEASGTTSAPSPASTTTTSGTDKKDNVKGMDVPKGKALVPGFGIVMSMQLLNSGYNLQQEQMKEYINLLQEQDYERQQNILLEFISANDTGDRLFNTSAIRWRSILRDNPLQRFDGDD